MPKGRVISYVPCQVKPHEANLSIHGSELAVVVFSLKVWRHYLYGVRYYIFIDHKSLTYIFAEKELNMRQRRWLELLNNCGMEIK